MIALVPARRRAPDAAGPLTYLTLGGTALLFVAPFWYMLVAASRPMAEMNQWPPLRPATPWSNVTSAVEQQSIGGRCGLRSWSRLIAAITVRLHAAGFAFAQAAHPAAGTRCSRSPWHDDYPSPPSASALLDHGRPGTGR